MPKPSGSTRAHATALLICALAERVIDGYGGLWPAPPLYLAALDAVNDEETCAIGRAILARHESLADVPYRFGGDHYPADLAVIAQRLGWEG